MNVDGFWRVGQKWDKFPENDDFPGREILHKPETTGVVTGDMEVKKYTVVATNNAHKNVPVAICWDPHLANHILEYCQGDGEATPADKPGEEAPAVFAIREDVVSV